MTYHVTSTDTGELSVTVDQQPITPAEARRLARDLDRAAGAAEHTLRCLRDAR